MVVLSSRVEEGRTGGASPPGEPELERVALESGAIGDFDPEATGGDGSESPESVTNVNDDNPSTIWDTETYQCDAYGCDFTAEGAPKPGVGLTLDAGEPVAAERLDLTVASETGWNVEVYAADGIPDSIEGWGEPIGERRRRRRGAGDRARHRRHGVPLLPGLDHERPGERRRPRSPS